MAKYKCRFCGFGANWDRNKKICPYCNKKDAMREEENAEELVLDA